jgi:YgiT-type zinc finger domain-containing protein
MDRLDDEKEIDMLPFPKCPICGGEVALKSLEKIVRGGEHTAIVPIEAEVCLHCGERLYSSSQVRYFEQVRDKLERQDLDDLRAVGRTFRVD